MMHSASSPKPWDQRTFDGFVKPCGTHHVELGRVSEDSGRSGPHAVETHPHGRQAGFGRESSRHSTSSPGFWLAFRCSRSLVGAIVLLGSVSCHLEDVSPPQDLSLECGRHHVPPRLCQAGDCLRITHRRSYLWHISLCILICPRSLFCFVDLPGNFLSVQA